MGLLLGIAIGLTLLQVAVATVGPEDGHIGAAYQKLFQWDSVWYADIAEHGYEKRATPFKNHPARTMENWTEFSNGGFFPGYPLVASIIRQTTGISVQTSLLLAAQLMSVVFWTYLLLLLRQLQIARPWQIAAVALIFCYPTSFYLVSGYAESTFLACTLGYFFWSAVPQAKGVVLAGLHGILLTATRIVGIPLAMYPLVRRSCGTRDDRRDPRGIGRDLLMGAGSLCGVIGFFLLSAYVFGRWDFYLWVQKEGWDIAPQYAFPLIVLKNILIPFGRFPDVLTDPYAQFSINIVCAMTGLWMLIGLTLTDAIRGMRMRDGTWRTRAPFLLCSAMMFYLYIAGLLEKDFTSMARYMLTVHVLLVLALTHLLTSVRWKSSWGKYTAMIVIAIVSVIGLSVERRLSGGFIAGGWVA